MTKRKSHIGEKIALRLLNIIKLSFTAGRWLNVLRH